MNIQQLEYIIAVDKHRHFLKAADACFITQATLSMMIKKLEEELGILIFDRSKQPVVPTETGKLIIEQSKIILKEINSLKNISSNVKSDVQGELRIGIIPTLAPYLLPLFLYQILKKYPLLKFRINELNTEQIIQNLSNDILDVGILATPLNRDGIREYPLFYERLKVYVSKNEKQLKKKFIIPQDIDVNRLLLLEEGHCLRSQMMNLCELRNKNTELGNLEYEAGSIESILKIVESNNGITIIPELAALNFNLHRQKQIREFRSPVPVREISLVTYRHFVKSELLNMLSDEIKKAVSDFIPDVKKEKRVIEI